MKWSWRCWSSGLSMCANRTPIASLLGVRFCKETSENRRSPPPGAIAHRRDSCKNTKRQTETATHVTSYKTEPQHEVCFIKWSILCFPVLLHSQMLGSMRLFFTLLHKMLLFVLVLLRQMISSFLCLIKIGTFYEAKCIYATYVPRYGAMRNRIMWTML